MKVSAVPWEMIWLLCLILLVVVLLQALVKQIKARRFSLKQNLLVYICLILSVGIPYTLPMLGYRFMVGQNAAEYTDIEHPISGLRSQIFEGYSIDQLYHASLAAVQSARTYGQPWHIHFAELSDGYSGRIVVQVPVWWYHDELTISIFHRQAGLSRQVDLYSQSPDREYDLGENARHIRQFYEALAAELAKTDQ